MSFSYSGANVGDYIAFSALFWGLDEHIVWLCYEGEDVVFANR